MPDLAILRSTEPSLVELARRAANEAQALAYQALGEAQDHAAESVEQLRAIATLKTLPPGVVDIASRLADEIASQCASMRAILERKTT